MDLVIESKDSDYSAADDLTFEFLHSGVTVETHTVAIPAITANSVGTISVPITKPEQCNAMKVSGTISATSGDIKVYTRKTMSSGAGDGESIIAIKDLIELVVTQASNSVRVEEIDPVDLHYINDHVVDEANEAAGTYRTEVSMAGYRNGSIQWELSGGVTMTLFVSNDPDADTSSDAGWEDVTSSITGSASQVDNSGFSLIPDVFRALKIMVKRVTSDSTNASDVFIMRGN